MPADYSDDSTTSSMPTVKASEKFGGDDNKSLESLVRQGDESVMDKYGSKAGVGSSSSSSAGKEANNTDDHEEQLARRKRAWDQLQTLERYYNAIKDKVLEEREKELESSEQAVRNGTDSEYEKNVRIIESTRENARNAAKRRFEMLKSNVESQFDCSLRQHKREFVQRRADLRRQMQKMAVKISLSLQEEFKDMEKTRLGVRIRMMEHLWRRSSPSVLPQTSEVPVDSESLSQLPNTTPVAPVSASRSIPVVQQYEWQMRENYQILTSYLDKRDEYGAFIPPPLNPRGLHPKEIEGDVELIRNAEATLG